jgi:hypothetical protein
MRRTRIRALATLATSAAVGLLLLMPAGAIGGPSTKGADHIVELFCDGLTGDDGTLFFGATISDVNGVSAGLDAFATGDEPFVDPAAFTAAFEPAPSASYAGGLFALEIPIVDGSGDPAGSAVIEATLVDGGAAEPISDIFRDGNHRFRQSGTFMPLSIASGSATLPDGSSYGLEDGLCFADEIQVTFFGNNPTSAVRQFGSNNVSCPLLDGDAVVGNLFVDVDSDRSSAFVDAFFFDATIEAVGDGPIIKGHLALDLSYFNFDTGDDAGPGALDMTLAATGERFSYTLTGGTGTRRVHGEIYDIEGTLTAPGFEPFDLGDCTLTDQTSKEIRRPARAPATTGRPPANDLPSGARSVSVGTTLTQQTKNTALDMEEPFPCLDFVDDEGTVQQTPVIKTVWYSIVGAGAPVTLNTKGSGFDTVLAVYERAGDGSLGPVADACNDDVPLRPLGRTLQAAVTFTAAAGTRYLIQIGGFPDDLNWGSLHLTVR